MIVSRQNVRRGILAVVLCVVLGALGTIPDPARGADQSGVSVLRRWRPTNLPTAMKPGDLTFETASAQRVLYAAAGNFGQLFTYDLDSLKPLTAPIAVALDAMTAAQSTGDLVVAASDGRTTNALVVYRLAGKTLSERGRIDLAGTLAPGQRVLTVTLFDEDRGALLLSVDDPSYVLASGYRGTAAVPGSMTITRVDLKDRKVEWSEQVPACALPVATNTKPGLAWVPQTQSIYFACTAPHPPAYKTAVPTGVGRLVQGESGRSFELFPRAGGYFETSDSVVDAGSGRLLLVAQTSGAGISIYAFDGRTNSWVGSIANGEVAPSQVGMDSRKGRIYTLGNDPAIGLIGADVRSTPVSQGRNFPALTFDGEQLSKPRRGIAVDEVTSRLFLVYGGEDIVIAEDDIPPFEQAERPNPDDNTVQAEELPGITGATYGGAVQGYGALYRVVGGYANLQFNLVPFSFDSDLPVGGGTRELRGAWIDGLSFRNGEASASAIGAERDSGNTARETEDTPWPYVRAECFDAGDSPVTTTHDNAEARCDADVASEASSASGGGRMDLPGLTAEMGSSATTSQIRVDPNLGTVSRVASSANDIVLLGGRLRFGGVSVTSTARAHGRTGTAESTFDRRVRDVWLDGTPLCTSDCDPTDVAAAINGRFAGFLRVDFPVPDPAMLASPGGYQAVIRARPEQQLEAVTINEHPEDRIEVPGMVVTAFTDNTRPSRTVLQFAGTAVEARYGIYLLGGDLGPGGGGGSGSSGFPSSTSGGALEDVLPAFLGGEESTSDGFSASTADEGVPMASSARSGGLGRRLIELLGWGFLRNGFGDLVRTFLVWAILLAPVYLSARRRLFLDRGALLRRGES